MNKIELITQPETQEKEKSPNEALQKLKNLVEDYPRLDDSDKEDNEPDNGKTRSPSLGREESLRDKARNSKHTIEDYETTHDLDEERQKEDAQEKQEDPVLDDDGFEIPQGKIPLDGHFSTQELKEILGAAKEEGLLNENVEVKVLESNEIGDKIVIAEREENEEGEKDEDDKEDDDEGNKKDNGKSDDKEDSDKKEKNEKNPSK